MYNLIILSFKNKTCHRDEIKPFLLCAILDKLCPVLRKIFNISSYNANYLDVFKVARVVPIFKAGAQDDLTNFRPISTLSIFNKIFEKLLHNRLKDFIDSNNILSLHQFGFRSGTSTTFATLEFLDYVVSAFNKKQFCISLFLDLKKAFDTVDKELLLNKLNHYGIEGNFNKLIDSYLSNRKQYVQIDNFKSDLKPITTGLFQGSILSPLLFNICLLYTSPSPRDKRQSRMPSSA